MTRNLSVYFHLVRQKLGGGSLWGLGGSVRVLVFGYEGDAGPFGREFWAARCGISRRVGGFVFLVDFVYLLPVNLTIGI